MILVCIRLNFRLTGRQSVFAAFVLSCRHRSGSAEALYALRRFEGACAGCGVWQTLIPAREDWEALHATLEEMTESTGKWRTEASQRMTMLRTVSAHFL